MSPHELLYEMNKKTLSFLGVADAHSTCTIRKKNDGFAQNFTAAACLSLTEDSGGKRQSINESFKDATMCVRGNRSELPKIALALECVTQGIKANYQATTSDVDVKRHFVCSLQDCVRTLGDHSTEAQQALVEEVACVVLATTYLSTWALRHVHHCHKGLLRRLHIQRREEP